jgi:hypothetical protein
MLLVAGMKLVATKLLVVRRNAASDRVAFNTGDAVTCGNAVSGGMLPFAEMTLLWD